MRAGVDVHKSSANRHRNRDGLNAAIVHVINVCVLFVYFEIYDMKNILVPTFVYQQYEREATIASQGGLLEDPQDSMFTRNQMATMTDLNTFQLRFNL